MKTEFTKEELKEIEKLRGEFLDLDDQIKDMETRLKLLRKNQSLVFAQYFKKMNPEHANTFDRRLMPYGW